MVVVKLARQRTGCHEKVFDSVFVYIGAAFCPI
ncbi:hypothetical protein Mic7113_3591 [Allocoleopsis franciscana PCC 7113]|jgi:hypothetical protein|uniref:Uncharacterized protein n=1 Tax=Allocoleopsis franciscana PCC 7113 TaxID=1173027 RepID=K9WFW7_9CYAN|nr:hypothetical protein Mic7113_3591 [Allocoleopsis franciscana PCC 7113]